MQQSNERLSELFDQWYNHQITEPEAMELMELLQGADQNGLLEGKMKEAYESLQVEPFFTAAQKEHLADTILKKSSLKIFTLRRVAVAASVIVMLGLGTYLFLLNKPGFKNAIAKTNDTVPDDIVSPKNSKAMITLADGRKVALDSLVNGTLVVQGNVNVMKTADGQIVYNGSADTIEYNTLFNPRGSKIQPLTLNDGTKVWLNSESSIRFPTAFTGNERKVEITGEAYFEVTKDAMKKFIVSGNGVTTEVLGTHFNINTYADERSIKVTLLEGSVKVSKGVSDALLKPGQQAQVSGELKVINNVNVQEVMAWKNGVFIMNKADIGTIMRQVAKWYDVEIVYESGVPGGTITGEVPRILNLSEVLKVYEYSGVHFNIEGKKIVVIK